MRIQKMRKELAFFRAPFKKYTHEAVVLLCIIDRFMKKEIFEVLEMKKDGVERRSQVGHYLR